MIRIEETQIWGWGAALRGMRNPKNSWSRSDTFYLPEDDYAEIGQKDMHLMQQLFRAGSEHRKYLRMVHVSMDVTAPLYWWKEYDTYKVGTTANSCSTMHKLTEKEFSLEDFSTDHLTTESLVWMDNTVRNLNYWRDCYLSRDNDKECWWQMIQLLPSSYNQKRTIDFDYETAVRIIQQRSGHKLDEWHVFVKALEELPYMAAIRS